MAEPPFPILSLPPGTIEDIMRKMSPEALSLSREASDYLNSLAVRHAYLECADAIDATVIFTNDGAFLQKKGTTAKMLAAASLVFEGGSMSRFFDCAKAFWEERIATLTASTAVKYIQGMRLGSAVAKRLTSTAKFSKILAENSWDVNELVVVDCKPAIIEELISICSPENFAIDEDEDSADEDAREMESKVVQHMSKFKEISATAVRHFPENLIRAFIQSFKSNTAGPEKLKLKCDRRMYVRTIDDETADLHHTMVTVDYDEMVTLFHVKDDAGLRFLLLLIRVDADVTISAYRTANVDKLYEELAHTQLDEQEMDELMGEVTEDY